MAAGNKPIFITLAVVLAAIAGIVLYVSSTSTPEQVVTQKIEVPAATAPIVEVPPPVSPPKPEPVVELVEEQSLPPEPQFVLPLLDESDALIRDGVMTLTRHEGINQWLSPTQLIRKYVAFVDNIAHGQVAKEPVRALAPEGPFLVNKVSEGVFELDPASYDRYNSFMQIAVSVDARRAAEFYHLLHPLIQDAYSELGYGDKSFDDVVFQAMDRLQETPVIEGPIRLVQPVVMYRFEDEQLENLSASQKQLIRMGPENTRQLKAKIREISVELRDILER